MKNEGQQLILPVALEAGDTIGIAAPAGVFDRERFRAGLEVIESLGFKTLVPEEVFARERYLAGLDENRAESLNRLFRDHSVKAVLCARGGFGSLRILSRLDFDAIRENPKIFAGFSDITVLLSVIFEKTGLVTFHAPVITSLAEAGPETRQALLRAFTSAEPIEYRVQGTVVAPGVARGIVRGGNLSSLCSLVGTPHGADYDHSLLLLEDINEPAYRLERMLTQMRLAGCLNRVSGVLLGRFDRCGDEQIIYDVVRERFPGRIPILAGVAFGHGGDNLALPTGLPATLDADAGILRYHGPAVRGRER